MTLADTVERASNSSVLTLMSRVLTVALSPLVVAAIVGGLAILREHDRAIIELEARTSLTAERVGRQGDLVGEIYRRQTATEIAAAAVTQRLDAQAEQLRRIERLLERMAGNGAQP